MLRVARNEDIGDCPRCLVDPSDHPGGFPPCWYCGSQTMPQHAVSSLHIDRRHSRNYHGSPAALSHEVKHVFLGICCKKWCFSSFSWVDILGSPSFVPRRHQDDCRSDETRVITSNLTRNNGKEQDLRIKARIAQLFLPFFSLRRILQRTTSLPACFILCLLTCKYMFKTPYKNMFLTFKKVFTQMNQRSDKGEEERRMIINEGIQKFPHTRCVIAKWKWITGTSVKVFQVVQGGTVSPWLDYLMDLLNIIYWVVVQVKNVFIGCFSVNCVQKNRPISAWFRYHLFCVTDQILWDPNPVMQALRHNRCSR